MLISAAVEGVTQLINNRDSSNSTESDPIQRPYRVTACIAWSYGGPQLSQIQSASQQYHNDNTTIYICCACRCGNVVMRIEFCEGCHLWAMHHSQTYHHSSFLTLAKFQRNHLQREALNRGVWKIVIFINISQYLGNHVKPSNNCNIYRA